MRRNKVIAWVGIVVIAALLLSGFLYLRFANAGGDASSLPPDSSSSGSAVDELPHYHPAGERTNGEALTAAAEVNTDAKGWLQIAGTEIYAPVVQARDNTFYQAHNWRGAEDENGAYYFDSACYVGGLEELSPNVIIYGVNADTGSGDIEDTIKFNQLERYLDEAYFTENKTILLTISDFEIPYEITSVGYMDLKADAPLLLAANPPPDDFAQALTFIESINVHDNVVSYEGVTNIITLIAYTEDSTQALAVVGKLAL